MNLTGNGNVSVKELELMLHKHSGAYKRQADNYAATEREEKTNESVRDR